MVEAHTPSVQKKKYTTDYVFDSFGRMVDMTYPDGETLHYAYDNGGLLKAAWGEKEGSRYNYINSLLYDEFGQRTHIEYGNGTATNYTYDDKTRRLETLVTTLNAAQGNRQVQNLSYHYDLVGNIMSLVNGILVATNTALPAGPVSQSFGYDDLYQLTAAKGAYGFGPGKQNNYTNAFSYDTIGNMTRKEQVNQIIQPSATVTLPKETNYVLSYVYGSPKPHAVTDAGDKLYTYDAGGNMTEWKSKATGQKRTIIWNEENRVKEIDDNGKATYFLYDDAGERVVKRGQHGESIYVNRFYAVKNGELGTKHIFAGETRVLSKLVKTPNTTTANTTTTIPGSNGLNQGKGKKLGIIKRLPDGTTTTIIPPIEKDEFYYHGDHLGSSNMITDSYGAVYQHLEYFPYGESWIEEGGSHGGNLTGYKFTGKELDPETGLYYYGARYYDPVLSKWISADQFLDKYLPTGGQVSQLPGMGGIYNPLNLGLYSYSHQNPIKYMDPDGNSVDSALALISEHRDTINATAVRRGVSAQAIASIIFQEKLYGIGATLKDIPADIAVRTLSAKYTKTSSIGLAEMQLGRAAELLGLDISKPEGLDKAIAALANDETSIDLIARNISAYEKKLGREMTVQEATVAHNAGGKGLESFVKGEVKKTEGKIYSRSWGYQKEISKALESPSSPPIEPLPCHKTSGEQ